MNFRRILKTLGPGLLYAGAAVGVSHLVQSTRAGADYGFDLLWVLLLANILKYPFFQFAPRYTAITGNNLIYGYQQVGKWAIIVYALVTIATMFTVQAAVTIVTAGLIADVFNINYSNITICGGILIFTMGLLILGRYRILDKLIKYVIIILALSTIIAVYFAFEGGYNPNPKLALTFRWNNNIHLLFLVAFIGWMPAPIDVSVWHSMWSEAKLNSMQQQPELKESLLDFNIGYFGTIIFAVCFLSLGALVMHGSGESLSDKGILFSSQLINLYTKSIGAWTYPIIAAAAIATMFSTTLTCLDAFPRVLKPTTEIIIFNKESKKGGTNGLNWIWMIILICGSLILMSYLAKTMQFMINLATTISFITAPLFAILNYRVITDKHIPEEGRPSIWLKIYSWIGILFLSAFTVFFIVWKLW